jgi:hypothetical protein
MKTKKNLKMIELYPEIRNMLDTIKSERAIRHDTEAIYYSITETCKSLVPGYIMVQRQRMANNNPESKVKREVDMKNLKEEYKEEVKIKKGRNICEQIGGTINDKDMCTYTTYMFISKNNIQKGSITVPVEELSDLDIKNQYKKFDGTTISREEYEALL